MVVLFVDPDPAVRSRRASLLAQAGHSVHEAADAESAVAVAQQLEALDVLVAQGVLGGGFSGFDLRDAVRAKFPGLRTVVTSRDELSEFGAQVEDSVLLGEPVGDEALAAAVARAGGTGTAVDPEPPAGEAPEDEKTAPDAPPLLAPGTAIGNYVIRERLYVEKDSETYLAFQQAVKREVALVLLLPELLGDAAVVEGFLERSRVKAAITHPRIAPLYEAQKTGGWMYYTREMPHGRSIEELIATGAKFGEKTLADVIAGVGEAMSQAELRGYHYRMPTARDIFVDQEHEASIVNVFRPQTGKAQDYAADTGRFLMMLRPLCDGPRARHLVEELARQKLDWEKLRRRAVDLQEQHRQDSLLRRADSKEAHEIVAARSAAEGISFWAWAGLALAVVGSLAVVVLRSSSEPPVEPLAAEMVVVPAGEFIFQRDGTRALPEFWIDKYEVTISQYDEFLRALAADPKRARAWDHPDQPASKKTHKPGNWDGILAAARSGGEVDKQRVDVNTPVVNVDWWDAAAYAKWRGRRLPTEEEWEKAARGTEGFSYPWGDEPMPRAANLGDDFDAAGRNGGKLDGFNRLAPVNKNPRDVSPFGVVGMAGNVEEWTATWADHPDYPDKRVPLVRGGSFATKSSAELLTARLFYKSPESLSEARGFRTASDQPPPVP
jgi:formylglycine-generating enzyme required for sulfatase activity/CheY-like chemotaxis protein